MKMQEKWRIAATAVETAAKINVIGITVVFFSIV